MRGRRSCHPFAPRWVEVTQGRDAQGVRRLQTHEKGAGPGCKALTLYTRSQKFKDTQPVLPSRPSTSFPWSMQTPGPPWHGLPKPGPWLSSLVAVPPAPWASCCPTAPSSGIFLLRREPLLLHRHGVLQARDAEGGADQAVPPLLGDPHSHGPGSRQGSLQVSSCLSR